MFELIESKVNNEIGNKKNEIFKLRKEKNNVFIDLMRVSEMIDAFNEIRDSKKKIFVFSAFLVSFLITSCFTSGIYNLILLVITLFDGMGLCNEFMAIKENRERLLDNCVNPEKTSYKELLKSEEILSGKLDTLEAVISLKEKSILEYNGMKTDINKLRSYSESLSISDEKLEKAKNYFSMNPELVFDTVEEYNNYMSYDDQFIKGELIKGKILEKKKDR